MVGLLVGCRYGGTALVAINSDCVPANWTIQTYAPKWA